MSGYNCIATLYAPGQLPRHIVVEVPWNAPDYALQVRTLRAFEFMEDWRAFGSVSAHAKAIRGEIRHTQMYTYSNRARHIQTVMALEVEQEFDNAWDFFAAIDYDHEAGRYKDEVVD